ncbi:hypothetical protein SAMN00767673_3188 [Rubrobacter radiotolerans DSM 5868]|nr:hypothetical protein SAMN00767673_3188 [Rubrobacter radiotolerans DSM 5868]
MSQLGITQALHFWASVVLVLGGVGLVGYFAWSALSDFPPGSTLAYGDRTVTGVTGSYCNYNSCVDVAFTEPPGETLRVPAGETLAFEYGGWATFGVEARAYPADPDGGTNYPTGELNLPVSRGSGIASLSADLPPERRYLLEVLVRAQSGSVSYLFQVETV